MLTLPKHPLSLRVLRVLLPLALLLVLVQRASDDARTLRVAASFGLMAVWVLVWACTLAVVAARVRC